MNIDSRVSGKTKLVGLIGNPVEHTVSPLLHNTISSKLGIDMIYVPMKVEKDGLMDAVSGLKALNFTGFNVTVPYKNEVMKFIDDISKDALLMGAVNTVKIMNGRLYGYNTDGEGFSRSFKEESGTTLKDKKVVMLGAGGAARAIAVKLALEGAKKITVINRTVSKAEEICQLVNNNLHPVAEHYGWDDVEADVSLEESDVIINTTSSGMFPDVNGYPYPKPINFSARQIVYDVIYNPSKTRFLEEAERCGCTVINGLGMLFYQGIYAYEIWTEVKLGEELLKDIFSQFRCITGST